MLTKLALIATGVSALAVEHVNVKQPFNMMGANGDMSCYVPEKAKAYRGLQDSTKSGRKCQNWTAVKPHAGAGESGKTASSDAGLGNHSYCRAPSADFPAPWCYTLDPAMEKEECSIPECKATGAFARDFPAEATETALKIGSKDCECADQLYGSTTTTKDTSVPGASFL
jgi:hypothetical protein